MRWAQVFDTDPTEPFFYKTSTGSAEETEQSEFHTKNNENCEIDFVMCWFY